MEEDFDLRLLPLRLDVPIVSVSLANYSFGALVNLSNSCARYVCDFSNQDRSQAGKQVSLGHNNNAR